MVSLSAFDLLYILGMILVFSIKELNNDYIVSGVYYYLLPWVLPAIQIGMTGSIYFTMAITVERYVTVCHPFYRYVLLNNWLFFYSIYREQVCPIRKLSNQSQFFAKMIFPKYVLFCHSTHCPPILQSLKSKSSHQEH